MGVDTVMYIRTVGKRFPETYQPLHSAFKILVLTEDDKHVPYEASHEIATMQRYYDVGYERGPWPDIASTLMILMASPDILRVWYYGDNSDAKICTLDTVLSLTAHYMRFGNRPYHHDF